MIDPCKGVGLWSGNGDQALAECQKMDRTCCSTTLHYLTPTPLVFKKSTLIILYGFNKSKMPMTMSGLGVVADSENQSCQPAPSAPTTPKPPIKRKIVVIKLEYIHIYRFPQRGYVRAPK